MSKRMAQLIAAGLSGDRRMRAAVEAEVALDEMGFRIRAVGGSDADVEEAMALVRAKLAASQAFPAAFTVADAVDEVLRPWMTGEKRPEGDA